ncbi:hypothetical protein D2Q93_05910 [Alicyclobacillaceae bacterium I2511]|nr:hypothetical protein D2Q93_05910 [Alicyclobacillaceae bacterium I2511]
MSVKIQKITFAEVETRFRQYTHHPFLRTAHVTPTPSRFHFEVGRAILMEAHIPIEVATDTLAAVLLLQEGLTIHETVDQVQDLHRQLRVLAGDYCSSWYYRLITRVSDNSLMAALSQAVVEINEAKMALFTHLDMCEEEYLTHQDIIQGSLLGALIRVFIRASEQRWKTQVASLVRGYGVQKVLQRGSQNDEIHHPEQYEQCLLETAMKLRQAAGDGVSGMISQMLLQYLQPIQTAMDHSFLAEGNRG